MHELALAQSIVEAGLREKAERKLVKVAAMHVTVGGLTHVEPENLVFCFEASVKGTELEGCKLVVHKKGLQAKCRRCARSFEVIKSDFRCPDCGVADVELDDPGELTLTSIEAQTNDQEN